MKKLLKITLTLFITLIIVLGFAVPVNMPNGSWYQQFFPNMNERLLTDITFTDSLNGYAIFRRISLNDTSFVLKSTNGGINWSISYLDSGSSYNRVMFINENTGFLGGFINKNNSYKFVKTTNNGSSWFYITAPFQQNAEDMYVLSEDSIWFVNSENLTGGVFKTTNGGANWTVNNTIKPDKIYMLNGNTGFCSRGGTFLYKTTNNGVSWSTISGETGFKCISFVDSLTGWKSLGGMKKTTNGGLNWAAEILPSGGMIVSSSMRQFTVLNKDTIIGAGGYVQYPNMQVRGMVLRTTDGGNIWRFQIPDTNINSGTSYAFTQFLNTRVGWVHTVVLGAHTTNGGDTSWITPVVQISTEMPEEYRLYQNYPNPFNPKTNIKYNVKRQTSNVKLIVYDIQGRFITELVNQKQNAGTYEVDWNATGYSSGVYFYKLTVNSGKEVFTDTKKMLLIK